MFHISNFSTYASLMHYLVPAWRGNRKGLNWLVRLACYRWKARCPEEFYISDSAGKALEGGCNLSPEALVVLKERAVNDPAPENRGAALRAITIGWILEPEACDFLMERATSDPESAVRASTLDVMMLFSGELTDIVEFIEQRAVSDPNLEVRAAAVRALFADQAFLTDRAESDPEPKVRVAALEELAVRRRDWDTVLMTLIMQRAVSDPDASIRSVAAQLLMNTPGARN